jgi:hypothetical protein
MSHEGAKDYEWLAHHAVKECHPPKGGQDTGAGLGVSSIYQNS